MHDVFGDSGMVSNFQPSRKQKPEYDGFFGRIQRVYDGIFRKHSANTSEQGSSSFSAPSVASLTLSNLRYERRAILTDTNIMYRDDPRVRKSINKYVREAVRDGCVIVVANRGRGITGSRYIKAQQLALHTQKIVNPLVESWGCMTLVEGELFVQACISDDQKDIIAAKRMPCASMERNSDDTDSFPDPAHAFSQVDTLTNGEVATFPLALMNHMRWDHVDGERYGTSDLIAVRRYYRLIEMMSEAQMRRRMARASQMKVWGIGTPENPGQQSDVDKFKETNGFNEGRREALNPMEVSRDVFHNGPVIAQVLEGDQTVHEVGDLEFFQNVFICALPTPGPLFNMASTGINRDILSDMRAEWLKDTKALTKKLTETVAWLFELALMLQGIDPRFIEYSVQFSESSIETPTEILNRSLQAYNNGYGLGPSFVWNPIITKEQVLQNCADILGVANVPAMLAAADAEAKAAQSQAEAAQAKAQTTNHAQIGSTAPQSNGHQNGNGALSVKPVQPVHVSHIIGNTPFKPFSGNGQLAAKPDKVYGEPQDAGV